MFRHWQGYDFIFVISHEVTKANKKKKEKKWWTKNEIRSRYTLIFGTIFPSLDAIVDGILLYNEFAAQFRRFEILFRWKS